jgi:hypothetical protein
MKRKRIYLKDRDIKMMEKIRKTLPNICSYCGEEIELNKVTVDHMLPVSRGGKTTEDNLCISCNSCNQEKSNMTVSEYKMFLKRKNKCKTIEEVEKARKKYLKKSNIITRKIKIASVKDSDVYKMEYKTLKKLKIDPKVINVDISEQDVLNLITYYKKHKTFDKIIKTYNRRIIEGYDIYLAAIRLGFKRLPVMRMYS